MGNAWYNIPKVGHKSFLLTFSVVLSVEQPSSGGWLCRSAAISGDSWNCSGAVTYSAGLALSLCYTGPAAQVRCTHWSKTAYKCQKLHATLIWLNLDLFTISLISHWVWVCVCVYVCCRSTCLPISDTGGRSLMSLDAFRNPTFRGLFLFLLRGEAGSGDQSHRKSLMFWEICLCAFLLRVRWIVFV